VSPNAYRGDCPLYTDVLLGALRRATFGLDLRWRAPGDQFIVTREEKVDRIRDAFRFDDDGLWLEMEAQASEHAATLPSVRIRVSVPASGLDADAALRAANAVNGRGLAPVHYDQGKRTLVVQQTIVFTGFNETPGVESNADFAFARQEATLNMASAVFAAAHACAQAV